MLISRPLFLGSEPGAIGWLSVEGGMKRERLNANADNAQCVGGRHCICRLRASSDHRSIDCFPICHYASGHHVVTPQQAMRSTISEVLLCDRCDLPRLRVAISARSITSRSSCATRCCSASRDQNDNILSAKRKMSAGSVNLRCPAIVFIRSLRFCVEESLLPIEGRQRKRY